MLRSLRGRTLLAALAVLVALSIAAVALGAVDPDDRDARLAAAPPPPPGCGTQSVATVAAVQSDGRAAASTPRSERGAETRRDAARVRSYPPLLAALEAGEAAAVAEAVAALVYKPHWHIVRLRVIRRGRVLADVGGPRRDWRR